MGRVHAGTCVACFVCFWFVRYLYMGVGGVVVAGGVHMELRDVVVCCRCPVVITRTLVLCNL